MSDHKPYVTVTSGMRGFFAVLVVWNPKDGGFYEPWSSSPFSSATPEGAVADAREWADAEGVEYRP